MNLVYNPFYVNQRLELAPYDSITYLASRIEDFQGENLVVAMPMRNSIPLYLPIGSLLCGKALASEGILFSFDSMLLEYTMKPIPFWVIKKPTNILQIQQRNFFRYEINLSVKYFLLDENSIPIENTEKVVPSRNLSGGGVLLLLNKSELPIGTMVWMEIPLFSGYTIKTMAKVARINAKVTPDGETYFLVGVQFIYMEEFTIKRIVNFLNKKVLEQRSKGIL